MYLERKKRILVFIK